MEPDSVETIATEKTSWRHHFFVGGALVVLGVLACIAIFFIPTKNFPVSVPIVVEEGDSIRSFARRLDEGGYIRHEDPFVYLYILLGNDRALATGSYIFDRPYGLFGVTQRIHQRDFGIERVKVTIREGMTRFEMKEVFSEKIDTFDEEYFMEITRDDEGYLFPDTYFFFTTATTDEVVETLRDTYERRVGPYRAEIEKSGFSENEILTMASIIEKEASGDDDRHVISGILWKRIQIGMPLQVDATFSYLLGKASSELTVTDLQTDSPYNTYTNKGLPPGPIASPGLLSIEAALRPESSPYLYYLHDSYGTIHYARNFEEHKMNKSLYLD